MVLIIQKLSAKFLEVHQRTKGYLLNTRKKLMPPIVDYEGVRICLGKHISQNIETTIWHGYYEKAEIELLKSYLSPNDTVMEVGAGIGFLSTYCAKRVGSNQVFAYEANPALETHIRKTYRINNVHPTLEICLIGERAGLQDFYITSDFWTSSFVKHSPETIKKTISVATKSFEQELKKIDPSLLIIDIEGGEYELFKNSNLYNVQKIIIELHNSIIGREKVEVVKKKLSDAGFQVMEKLYNCDDEILFLKHLSS